jgi:ribulose-phosphate 3-epimerase
MTHSSGSDAVHISPSILSADYGALRDKTLEAVAAGGSSIHVDIMDGHYVHNFSFGIEIFRALKPHVSVPLVAHLEIAHPDHFIDDFATAGADTIIVQEDTCPNLPFTVRAIREAGVAAGIGINPDRSFRRIEAHPQILQDVEIVVVMGVYPGFGGQLFAATTIENIGTAVRLREENGARYMIGVDGGVTTATTPAIVQAGASCLIAGSAVFGGDVAANIAALRQAAGEVHGGAQ